MLYVMPVIFSPPMFVEFLDIYDSAFNLFRKLVLCATMFCIEEGMLVSDSLERIAPILFFVRRVRFYEG